VASQQPGALSQAIIHLWELIVKLKAEKEHDRVSVKGEEGFKRLLQPIDPFQTLATPCPA